MCVGATAEQLCRNAGPSEDGRPLPGAQKPPPSEASGLGGGARTAVVAAVGGEAAACTDHAAPKPHSGGEGEGAWAGQPPWWEPGRSGLGKLLKPGLRPPPGSRLPAPPSK